MCIYSQAVVVFAAVVQKTSFVVKFFICAEILPVFENFTLITCISNLYRGTKNSFPIVYIAPYVVGVSFVMVVLFAFVMV